MKSECFQYLFLHNDKLKACEDFKDSILIKGTSLYEVMRIMDGKALFLSDHLDRLNNSARKMNLELQYSREEIENFIQLLVEKNDCQQGNIKLVFHFDVTIQNFYAYFVRHSYPTNEQYKKGVRCLVHQAERPMPTAKVYNHQLRSKTNTIIDEADIFEVILMNALGDITEGSRSNLFFIKNDELYTAPDKLVLNGIARSRVIQIAKKLGITIHYQCISYEDLPKFDAAFLTGTSPMVLPICRINSLSYSANHPLLKEILHNYQELIRTYLSIH